MNFYISCFIHKKHYAIDAVVLDRKKGGVKFYCSQIGTRVISNIRIGCVPFVSESIVRIAN
jgi:hypothetical protein